MQIPNSTYIATDLQTNLITKTKSMLHLARSLNKKGVKFAVHAAVSLFSFPNCDRKSAVQAHLDLPPLKEVGDLAFTRELHKK